MDVDFLGSFTAASVPRHPYPEVAVAGRSNVGKSSFINVLIGRHNIARVSSQPGKTRMINLYLLKRELVLADLPGYGYSAVAVSERRRWAREIEAYLLDREQLKAIVLLADIRHFPMQVDLEAVDWLHDLGKPVAAVLTKADKLGHGALKKRQSDISGLLQQKHVESFLFSAKTGQGKKEVWTWIARNLNP
jgi:GTP-binding protein